MSDGRLETVLRDSVIVRRFTDAAARAAGAWHTSVTRSTIRRALSQHARVDIIGAIGYALLGAALTHAMLLSLMTVYARPAYGVTGAVVMAGVAVVVIAFRQRLAAAWTNRNDA